MMRQDLLRILFEKSADPAMLLDRNTFIDCNDAAVRFFAYPAKESLIRRRPRDLSPERQPDGNLTADKEDELIARALKSGSVRFDWVFLRSDGGSIPVEVVLTAIPFEERQILYTVWRDISKRKAAEERLRESEVKYRTLFKAAPVGVIIMELRTGKILDFNDAACLQLGYGRAELGRLCIADLHVELAAEELKRLYGETLRGSQASFETSVRTREGGLRSVQVTAWVTELAGRHLVNWIVRDITATRHLEARLRQAQKMEAIGTLAGGIAHDFNNILAAIMGYTELCLRRKLPPDSPARDSLEQVLKAGGRARDLTRQILAFSRQTDGVRKPVQTGLLVKEVLKLLRASLLSTICIEEQIDDLHGTIEADPSQIHQIVMNLCSNAAQAMGEEGGDITVALEEVHFADDTALPHPDLRPGSYQRLAVRDNGCGIDASTMERMFEPFFTTKKPGDGTGMGLSVVYGIVKDHGGVIDVSSVPGSGTTVHVYFRRLENAAPPRVESGVALARGTESILFVDDERELVRIGKQMLEFLGYRVTAVASSGEAWEIFRGHPRQFDLVITDQAMPGMTGTRLCRNLLTLRPDIPIVLCTGYSDAVSREATASAGIRRVLMKPVTMAAMAKAIREVLDQRGDDGQHPRH